MIKRVFAFKFVHNWYADNAGLNLIEMNNVFIYSVCALAKLGL